MAYKNHEDQKAYARKHYLNNKELYKSRAKISNPKQRLKTKIWLLQYLAENPCVDCGEKDIEVLEFDHIEVVGQDARRVWSYLGSFKKLKEEVSKCEIRCSNCHTRRTRRQMGWTRDLDALIGEQVYPEVLKTLPIAASQFESE